MRTTIAVQRDHNLSHEKCITLGKSVYEHLSSEISDTIIGRKVLCTARNGANIELQVSHISDTDVSIISFDTWIKFSEYTNSCTHPIDIDGDIVDIKLVKQEPSIIGCMFYINSDNKISHYPVNTNASCINDTILKKCKGNSCIVIDTNCNIVNRITNNRSLTIRSFDHVLKDVRKMGLSPNINSMYMIHDASLNIGNNVALIRTSYHNRVNSIKISKLISDIKPLTGLIDELSRNIDKYVCFKEHEMFICDNKSIIVYMLDHQNVYQMTINLIATNDNIYMVDTLHIVYICMYSK